VFALVSVRALLSALFVLLALPAVAGASTVSVEPYREPPGVDPFESCSRYMQCPPDMLVLTGAPGEHSQVTIGQEESVGPQRYRYRVRDFAVQAGSGCEQVDPSTVVCAAGAVGPIALGDGDDQIATRDGRVSGGAGLDVLNVPFGSMEGNAGDDVLIGAAGNGDAGDDVLMVSTGGGGRGDDVLKCYPRNLLCYLEGGPGDDLLTGGTTGDRLFGGAGRDTLRGMRGEDSLDCGAGRRDSARTDRVDKTRACERSG
jgi:hypothetical protein